MRLPWRPARGFERPAAPSEVRLAAIGFVHNRVAKPRPRGWEHVESRIEVLEEHRARLHGLERYSHVLVVFYMDLAATAPDKPAALATATGHRYGVFATRSQLRPNHLGVSSVPVLGVDGTSVRVAGLDAIDGTPVLDLKPYLPAYDAHPGATIPPE